MSTPRAPKQAESGRGEVAALRWSDLDLDHAELTVARSRTAAGYQVHEGAPKTAAGLRTIALDKQTVKVLRAHRPRQQADRAQAGGQAWHPGGDASPASTVSRCTRGT